MSNEVALFEGMTLPVHMQNGGDLSETTKALIGGSLSNGKRVSIRGSVFRMMVGDNEVAKNDNRGMNMVIVAAAPAYARTYYSGTYDEKNVTPPKCWSDDGAEPSKQCAAAESSTCATCPQNIKGSGQGESKACRSSARIAVVLDGDLEGSIYGMSVPATSIWGEVDDAKYSGLQDYVRKLASFGWDVNKVVTEFRFDTEASTPKLMFRAVRPLTDEEWAIVEPIIGSQEATQHIHERTFSASTQPAKPVQSNEVFESADDEGEKPAKPAKAKAKAKPAAEEPQANDAEEEAPKKREKSKAPTPDDEDLDDLLAEWDDD